MSPNWSSVSQLLETPKYRRTYTMYSCLVVWETRQQRLLSALNRKRNVCLLSSVLALLAASGRFAVEGHNHRSAGWTGH